MSKNSPTAVLVALCFAVALASPALVADAAGPASKDYEKKMQPPPQSPANPNLKAWMDAQKNPNQPAKPAQTQPMDQIGSKLPPKPPAAPPQAVKPVAAPGKPPAPQQVTGQNTQRPGTPPQDPKKNATYVGKVNTAPGTPSSAKKPEAGYNATKDLLGR